MARLPAERIIKGLDTVKILEDMLPSIITSLNFPKSMRWADHELRFARPIRWIVALFGKDIVRFSMAGVHSGAETGQQYRFTFYHSPRPNNAPNDGSDNKIEFSVEVVSASGSLVNQTIGMDYSDSGTDWDKYSYDFVALDDETTIRFSDVGSQEDTLGGYIDAVSVYKLSCPDVQYPHGGTCTVWEERDLTDEVFWKFDDIKPGDRGVSIVSLHVYGNEAYACLFPADVVDDENTLIEPEDDAGDTTDSEGELSGELEFFVWGDVNANNAYDSGEPVYVPAGTPFNQIQQNMIAMQLFPNMPASLVGFNWCAGDQTLDGETVSCDGHGMGDVAQTDQVISAFVAYAEQQRNNESFSCATVQVQLPN